MRAMLILLQSEFSVTLEKQYPQLDQGAYNTLFLNNALTNAARESRTYFLWGISNFYSEQVGFEHANRTCRVR